MSSKRKKEEIDSLISEYETDFRSPKEKKKFDIKENWKKYCHCYMTLFLFLLLWVVVYHSLKSINPSFIKDTEKKKYIQTESKINYKKLFIYSFLFSVILKLSFLVLVYYKFPEYKHIFFGKEECSVCKV